MQSNRCSRTAVVVAMAINAAESFCSSGRAKVDGD